MDLTALFFSAFLAATLLPGGSEALLVYLDHVSQHGFWILLATATVGNTLGGMVSYAMGRIIPAHRLNKPNLQRAVIRIRLYGAPILMLAWVPFVGDVLCVAAGWVRLNWISAAVFIGIGKTARYALVMAVL